MVELTTWDEIREDLGSDINQFDDWLKDKSEEGEVTIMVTGVFSKDYDEFKEDQEPTTS